MLTAERADIMEKKILDWQLYMDKAAEAVSEGIVMLRNNNNALPLDKSKETALFGRIQLHYYKSGLGSGGLVNVDKVTGITDGLLESGVKLNQKLLDTYKKWDEENPYEIGSGWGDIPWSQKEMPVDDALAADIASQCDTAVAVIGRTAGEEQDNKAEKGSFLLSSGEEQMLEVIRRHFKKVIVLLNVGNIIDMSFVEKYDPDAVLYVWQGGMVGGTGTADVLTGKVSPSGKLPDTIPYDVNTSPALRNFGDPLRSIYEEDIYVGYRYYETFAPQEVMYPFGFGLSYSSFDIKTVSAEYTDGNVRLSVKVRNTGSYSGKETVQIYACAPQGKLGKPARALCGFEKTDVLSPDEEAVLSFVVPASSFASYDDSGATGYKSCFVLEKGEYNIYVGSDVRSAVKALSFTLENDIAAEQLTHALAPVESFKRMKPLQSADGSFSVTYEDVPLSETDENSRRIDALPTEYEYDGTSQYTLADVRNGKCTMEQFIACLTDYDLSCIIRGEGMGSPKVTAGTASAFGGVSDSLKNKMIPCGCCSDGPSGMRLDCGTKAFSLPNGTLLASTFNRRLLTELYSFTGREMRANNVDCLLGPGMNIHRCLLNGRNFEYFSEDPFLTGELAAAQLEGMHSEGVTGTIKHFCGNNQETGRHTIDSVVSERALREIYLKGFEIAIKKGKASTVMTTYGKVNGLWTAGSYDLCSVILRKDWGFDGLVMTDWWANINRRGCDADKSDFAAMAKAQNDIYMVCADGADNPDNTLASLESGDITRGELQRNAANICRVLLNTHAMDRMMGISDTVEIIGRSSVTETNDNECSFYKLDGSVEIIPENISTDRGDDYIFAVDTSERGLYRITLTGSSNSSELAQIPVTVFSMGSPVGTLTWNGTGGKDISKSCTADFFSRFTTLRIYFAQSGLKLSSIKIEKV